MRQRLAQVFLRWALLLFTGPMQITQSFRGRASLDAIQAAIEILCEGRDVSSATWTIDVKNAGTWTFDNRDEFFGEYRRQGRRQNIHLDEFYRVPGVSGGEADRLVLRYEPAFGTRVTAVAEDRSRLMAVMEVFDADQRPPIWKLVGTSQLIIGVFASLVAAGIIFWLGTLAG